MARDGTQKTKGELNDTILGRSNKRFDPTGLSVPLIDNLAVAQVSPGGSIAALERLAWKMLYLVL